MNARQIRIVLLGAGTVGRGVAEALITKADDYARRAGASLSVVKVLVRDASKDRGGLLPPDLLTADPEEALATDCDIVVELMGGEDPAREHIERSLRAGRYVVSGNKEVMAKHGARLLALAQESGTDLLYEASVGGGIPIVSPLKRDLAGNRITGIRAIINGTTNYILTRMSREGAAFEDALKQAQDLGYAEANPASDIEAHDPVFKLAILASLAFHAPITPSAIYREGITKLHPRDFRYAAELGYAIKLLAIARQEPDGVQARVHPALVPEDQLLAKVDGVLNAVQVEGDLVGRVLFQGAGAGSLPTASAVMSDVIEAARALVSGSRPWGWRYTSEVPVKPIEELVSRYYVRLEVSDQPGVLAGIASAFGTNNVSIASVIQKETDEAAQSAELVVMTHAAREHAVRTSMAQIEALDAVRDVGNVLRVEG